MDTKIKYDDEEIYELLNYAEIDKAYNGIYEVDEVTYKKIKRKINEKLKRNNKKRRIKYAATAAVILISLGSFVVSNPALAANIQKSIIHKIEKLRGDNSDYEKYVSNVNLESYDKGIKFVINEIASDSNKIIFSYSIISDKKLKDVVDNTNIISTSFKVDNNELNFGGYGGTGTLVNDNRYDGVMELNTVIANLPEKFILNMKVSKIDELEGNWSFDININKSEIQKKTKEYEINKEINLDEGKLIIKRIITSPLSTAIEISGDMWKYHYFLFDDKGNMINAKGGSSNEKVGELQFGSLINKDTKSLTFIPFDFNEDYKPNHRLYDINKLPLELEQGELGKLIVNNLEWNGNSLKVSYTAEGKVPVVQSQGLCLIDENNDFIIPENELSTQKYTDNQHDFEVIFKGVSKGKKYKIGTLRLEEFYKLHDEYKFTIELKN